MRTILIESSDDVTLFALKDRLVAELRKEEVQYSGRANRSRNDKGKPINTATRSDLHRQLADDVDCIGRILSQ